VLEDWIAPRFLKDLSVLNCGEIVVNASKMETVETSHSLSVVLPDFARNAMLTLTARKKEKTPVCVENTCKECAADLDCMLKPDKLKCLPNNNICVNCLNSTECRSKSGYCDSSCTGNQCIPGKIECSATGLLCRIEDGQCVGCLQSSDCNKGSSLALYYCNAQQICERTSTFWATVGGAVGGSVLILAAIGAIVWKFCLKSKPDNQYTQLSEYDAFQ